MDAGRLMRTCRRLGRGWFMLISVDESLGVPRLTLVVRARMILKWSSTIRCLMPFVKVHEGIIPWSDPILNAHCCGVRTNVFDRGRPETQPFGAFTGHWKGA